MIRGTLSRLAAFVLRRPWLARPARQLLRRSRAGMRLARLIAFAGPPDDVGPIYTVDPSRVLPDLSGPGTSGRLDTETLLARIRREVDAGRVGT